MWFIAVIGCFASPEQDALDAAPEKWEANAPSHYRYVEDEWAFAPSDGAVRTEVQDGEIVDAVIVETDEPAPVSRVLTMEELFDRVQNEIDGRPDDITVEYEASLGFPVSVDVDPISNAVDDEYGFGANWFETLE